MRYLGIFLLACACTLILAPANKSLAEDEAPRTIVGYSSELSVRAGDTVDFMVNSEPLKETIEEIKISTAPLSVHYTPAPAAGHGQADLVFFETASNGALFATGSITWMSSTPEKNYDNDVAKITHNVLKRFMDSKPFDVISHDEVSDDTARIPPNSEYESMDQR
jgi:hypothetical protein